MVNLRLDRTSRIRDPQVRALGEIDTAVEGGAFFGVTRNGVLHGYDFLTARIDVTHDLTNTHDSLIVTPNLEYATPLSRHTLVGLSVSADHVGGGYADTYFGVTPAGAAASGLTAYDADSGFKNVRLTLLGTQSLSGDLRRGLGCSRSAAIRACSAISSARRSSGMRATPTSSSPPSGSPTRSELSPHHCGLSAVVPALPVAPTVPILPNSSWKKLRSRPSVGVSFLVGSIEAIFSRPLFSTDATLPASSKRM
jgi:hypothetical protein